jgi:hypothetical protein
MLIATLSLALSAIAPVSFYEHGPYASAVPVPDQILGYELGSKHTVFADQERVVRAITDSCPTTVRRFDYGKSTEGRPLRVFAISSPENIQRLEEIRKAIGDMAEGKSVASDAGVPPIVWINQCIHGDETASFESAMALMYNLAASRNSRIERMMRNAVVILNPVYNPDGHERYVVAYNSIPGGSSSESSYDREIPSAFFGRTNHYRFDMNRDRISMSQAETRQEVAEFLRWNPQVYVDQHGQTNNYFFPPTQQATNVNVDRERYTKWSTTFGRATGKAFDAKGWTYFVRDQFDFYNACYLDTHTTLMGAIGMTHETDGGRVLSEKRDDNTILTMRDGAIKHLVSALAVIESAAENREALLASYKEFKASAVSGKHAGKFQRVVLESEDLKALVAVKDLLGRSGIESNFSGLSWTQSDAHNYWTGAREKKKFSAMSLVVDMAQSQGPLAKSLLEPGSDFEADFVARQLSKFKNDAAGLRDPVLDSFEFYDATAWSIPYGHGIQAWWCESAPRIMKSSAGVSPREPLEESSVGYWFPYTGEEGILFAAKLSGAGVNVRLVTKPMVLGGTSVSPGSFVVLAARNEVGYEAKIEALAELHQASVYALPTNFPDNDRFGPGGSSVIPVPTPKLGIYHGAAGSLACNELWYLMEREFNLAYEPLGARALRGSGLNDFTSIVFERDPDLKPSSPVGAWVRGGGTAVILRASSSLFTPDVLGSLKTLPQEAFLPGSIYLAQLDALSPLSFGYARQDSGKISVAVPMEGDEFWVAPAGADVSLSADPKVKKLLSGWEWPTTEKNLTGALFAHTFQLGRGKVVVFTQDPTARAQWRGLHRMLLNAMILVPGT